MCNCNQLDKATAYLNTLISLSKDNDNPDYLYIKGECDLLFNQPGEAIVIFDECE